MVLQREQCIANIVSYISKKSGVKWGTVRWNTIEIIKKNDDKINVDVIIEIINKIKTFTKRHYSPTTSETKADILSYKTVSLMESGLLPKSVNHYVDHGCGSGIITTQISKVINAKEVSGIDIYVNSNAEFPVIVPDKVTGLISIESNSIDFMTALLSLHHVHSEVYDILTIRDQMHAQEIAVSEIARMLTPGGSIVIYDHDVDPDDTYMRLFLDAVHMTFMIFGTDSGDNQYLAEKIDRQQAKWIIEDSLYRSKSAWRDLFAKYGLLHVGSYCVTNSQRMYFDKFVKQ